MTGPDMRPVNGVMYFDRSTYPKSARTIGQMTLDGAMWTAYGYVAVGNKEESE